MTSSRTPVRLTPHRGPLATPSTSPESSPTLSTPPSDISYCSANTASSLDFALLQHRISALSPPMLERESTSPLHRRRRRILPQGLFSWRAHLSRLSLALEDLVHLVWDLAKILWRVVAVSLLIWAFLEWTLYASEPRQPTPWITTKQFPLPNSNRTLHCHANPSLREPSDQQLAILQFLSDQVQHAKAMSSLNAGLGLPLLTFIEGHRTAVPRLLAQRNLPELPFLLVQEGDMLTNLTELLDAPLLDFRSGSFIGRSFTLALDELGDLISKPVAPHGSAAHGQYRDAHLHAIYWRTTSNLILEYSAARPRARHLLQYLHTIHKQLSPIVSDVRDVERMDERSNIWWWQDIVRHSAISVEDRMREFVTGLETTLDNVHRLAAYLDWITEQLASSDDLDGRFGDPFLGGLYLMFDVVARTVRSVEAFDIEEVMFRSEQLWGDVIQPAGEN